MNTRSTEGIQATKRTSTVPIPARHAARLTWVCGLALMAMVALVLAWMPGLDGIRMAIRATARTSLLLFLLAYGAGAASALRPSVFTLWLRAHRRQWGWLFVISHTLHAACIAAFFFTAPDAFAARVTMPTLIGGGLAFVVIWAMGATSFDRTAALSGPVAWARLHTWGSHYIWLIFVMSYGKRIAQQPVALLPILLLLAVQVMRWRAARRLKAAPAIVAPA